MPTCTATCAQDTQAVAQARPHDQLKRKLPPMPDLDNRRFCRACQISLPMSSFPSGKRRYLCKRHLWERVQRPSKKRALAKGDKRRLWTIWKTCYHDAMRTFKHKRILLLQRDIKQTLAQIEDAGHGSDCNTDKGDSGHRSDCNADKEDSGHGSDKEDSGPEPARSESDRNAAPSNEQPAVHPDMHRDEAHKDTEQPAVHREELHREEAHTINNDKEQPAVHQEKACNDAADSEFHIALMPLNPEQQLSRDNVVVVDKTARHLLLQAFRQGGADQYISELEAMVPDEMTPDDA